MSEDPQKRKGRISRAKTTGIVSGAGIGMIFGAMFGNVGFGLVLGVALGIIVGTVLVRTQKKIVSSNSPYL